MRARARSIAARERKQDEIIARGRVEVRERARKRDRDRESDERQSQRMPKFSPLQPSPPTERTSIVLIPSRSGLRGPVRRRSRGSGDEGGSRGPPRVRYESLCREGGPHTRRLTAGWHPSSEREQEEKKKREEAGDVRGAREDYGDELV